jgi:transposase-like protein
MAMMAEREVTVSHTTIMRWVRHYVPEYERRWSRFSKPTDSSWRMDETTPQGSHQIIRIEGLTAQ